MRVIARVAALAVLAFALAGCGATADDPSDGATSAEASAASPVNECVERFMERVDFANFPDAEEEDIRQYVRVTYCSRFADRGWVYDDGTLSIDAHKWLDEGTEEDCAMAEDGEPARTVPCEEPGEDSIIDCALLHHVRRSEVRGYVEQLRREDRNLECDDGTPLDELGSPG